MKYLTLYFLKFVSFLTTLKGGGTTYPGYLGLKISKNMLKNFKLPEEIIIVTATNGKTTTTNLINEILKTEKKVITNLDGANMLSGILSLFIKQANYKYEINSDIILLEVDEMNVPLLNEFITPKYMIVNNFFRDQLDRYGEIEKIINTVFKTINSKTNLILNANDPLVYNQAKNFSENKIIKYGISKTNYSVLSNSDVKEAKFCPNCNVKLNYEWFHYAHIGKYNCENCTFKTPKLDYEISNINLENSNFTYKNKEYTTNFHELYNFFNVIAAISIADQYNISFENIENAIKNFKMDKGRMERFSNKNQNIILNLAKNPTGLEQTINVIVQKKSKSEDELILILNNNFADGKDTSWIWDVNFEKLSNENITKIYCSGIRAYDMASRVFTANLKGKIVVNENIADLMKQVIDNKKSNNVYIIANYTAIKQTREILLKELKNNGN